MLNVLKWIGIGLIGLVLLVLVSSLFTDGGDSDGPSFSEFLDRVEAGEVSSVTLVPVHEELEVEPSSDAGSGDGYEVAYPVDYTDGVVDDLRQEGVPIDVDTGAGTTGTNLTYFLPLAMFVGFWVWLARRLRRLSDDLGARRVPDDSVERG